MVHSVYTLYSVTNATLHLKFRNFTPLPHNMFRPQRAIIRCIVMLKLSPCIKYIKCYLFTPCVNVMFHVQFT
jgi:hypothetical protein